MAGISTVRGARSQRASGGRTATHDAHSAASAARTKHTTGRPATDAVRPAGARHAA